MRFYYTFVFFALSGAGTVMGSPIAAPPPDPAYTYVLHLPTISGGVEVEGPTTDYTFSWVGPLRFNSPPNSACPTVCGPVAGGTVKAGESFAGFSFTAAGPNPEVNVLFSDFSGADFSTSNTVTFTFIEPDAFWAATGGQPFASNTEAPPAGTGASFAIGGSDPGCNACSLDTASAPEPNSSILLATIMTGFVVLMRLRLKPQPVLTSKR